jgi:anthranilate synthase component 1
MQLQPDFAAFEAGWAEGRNQIVHARLAADLDTPRCAGAIPWSA